jgi:hypothetical protein
VGGGKAIAWRRCARAPEIDATGTDEALAVTVFTGGLIAVPSRPLLPPA